MATIAEAQTISVGIARDWQEVYAFASTPENVPRWASGLGSTIRQVDGEWVAEGTEGPNRIRFSAPNPFGILDHHVVSASGAEAYIPLRVIPNGSGAELVFTLFRVEGMTDEQFAADARAVQRDLETLKSLLEPASARPTGSELTGGSLDRPLRIDYVELQVQDLARAQRFYEGAFRWGFTDYGPEYRAFHDGRLEGGFAKADAASPRGPLVILYAPDLEDAQRRIEAAGGRVVQPIYAFPGGRRLHFADPDGYELAVWSDR